MTKKASNELWNQEAEALWLAACLRHPDQYYSLNSLGLVQSDFLGLETRRIAGAVFDVAKERNPDVVLVLEALQERGESSAAAYMSELTTMPVNVPQAREYERTIKGLSIGRNLQGVGVRIIDIAMENRADYESSILDAEKLLGQLSDGLPEPERSPKPGDILRRLRNTEHAISVPITFSPTLQSITGGFAPGHFWVIGGFSSTGKTNLACNIALDVLRQRGKKVAVISAEMTSEQYMVRILSMVTGVPQQRIKDNITIGLEEQAVVEKWTHALERANILIYDNIYKMDAIKNEAKRLKEHQGLDVLIIDFIQNLSITGDEVKDAREVALECQRLAKELQCTVVAFSQVSNAMAQMDIEQKGAGDYYAFKGSGAIKDAADLAIMLRRDRRAQSAALKVQVAKNRHGPLAEFVCSMNLATGLIEEMREEQYDYDDET